MKSNVQFDNPPGHQFGKWTLLSSTREFYEAGLTRAGTPRLRPHYRVVCNCGYEDVILVDNLRSGKSSGCKKCRTEAGSDAKRTHGKAATPIYSTWNMLKQRMTLQSNPAWNRYGRVIDMDPRWMTFENFYADVGDKPHPKASLDRIDNSKGYWPWNVRWATSLEQANNTSRNRRHEYKGHNLTVKEWEHITGIRWQSIASRLYLYGLSIEEALTNPVLMPNNRDVKFYPRPVPESKSEVDVLLSQRSTAYRQALGWGTSEKIEAALVDILGKKD